METDDAERRHASIERRPCQWHEGEEALYFVSTASNSSETQVCMLPADLAEMRKLLGKPPWDDDPGDPMTNQVILETLQSYARARMINYVLPTDPPGEEWVLGLLDHPRLPAGDRMYRLHGKAEIKAFMMGIQVAALFRPSSEALAEMTRQKLAEDTAGELGEETAPPGSL
jgi:hypothetical protein